MKYKPFKINFHAHTDENAGRRKYNHYVSMPVEKVIDEFAVRGFDFLSLTEHHKDSAWQSFQRGCRYIKKKGYRIRLIYGYEADHHRVTLFDENGDTLRILAHPYRSAVRYSTPTLTVEKYIEKASKNDIQAIEVSEEEKRQQLGRIVDKARRCQLPVIAACDFHGVIGRIDNYFSYVFSRDCNISSIFEAVREGRVTACFYDWVEGKMIQYPGRKALPKINCNKLSAFQQHHELGPRGSPDFLDSGLIRLENKILRLVISQENGGRIISLYHKPTKSELTNVYEGLLRDTVPGRMISDVCLGRYKLKTQNSDKDVLLSQKCSQKGIMKGITIEKQITLKNEKQIEIIMRFHNPSKTGHRIRYSSINWMEKDFKEGAKAFLVNSRGEERLLEHNESVKLPTAEGQMRLTFDKKPSVSFNWDSNFCRIRYLKWYRKDELVELIARPFILRSGKKKQAKFGITVNGT